MHLKQIFIQALIAAYETHQCLGKKGEQTIHKNQFGDTALRADLECERAVLETLKSATLPITVISEEHGTTIIAEPAKYLGILDGIDGSSLYKKARGKGRYGTMFAVFNSPHPAYQDYLLCGIMQHATGRLLMAEKGQGAQVIEVATGAMQPIHTVAHRQLTPEAVIYIDESFEYNRQTFSEQLAEFEPKYEGASSLYYAALAEGQTDAVLECTRKANLEIAVSYGLIREAGGAVVDVTGKDVGDKKYLEFAQKETRGIISAANEDIAAEILQRIN